MLTLALIIPCDFFFSTFFALKNVPLNSNDYKINKKNPLIKTSTTCAVQVHIECPWSFVGPSKDRELTDFALLSIRCPRENRRGTLIASTFLHLPPIANSFIFRRRKLPAFVCYLFLHLFFIWQVERPRTNPEFSLQNLGLGFDRTRVDSTCWKKIAFSFRMEHLSDFGFCKFCFKMMANGLSCREMIFL